jgi:hypothetical protein
MADARTPRAAMADANLDAALQAEREARASRGVGLTGPASMDLELYGGAGVEYATELQDEEPSSGASARLASLPQRVIQQHNLEAEADGDAAMRRFRAENSSVSSAKIADREDEVRAAGLGGGWGRRARARAPPTLSARASSLSLTRSAHPTFLAPLSPPPPAPCSTRRTASA